MPKLHQSSRTSAATRLPTEITWPITLKISKKRSRPLTLLVYPISRTNACHQSLSMLQKSKAWKNSPPHQSSHLEDQATTRTWSTRIHPSAVRTCQKRLDVVFLAQVILKALSLVLSLVHLVHPELLVRLVVVASRRVTAGKQVCTSFHSLLRQDADQVIAQGNHHD